MRAVYQGLKIPFLCVFTLLVGCGGDSDDYVQAAPQTDFEAVSPIFSSDQLTLYGELTAEVGDSVGFVVIAQDGSPISEIQWQQTSGPELIILAGHTQAIGFDLLTAGSYAFTVNAITNTQQARSLSFSLDVAPRSDVQSANIRLDHMATERGRVSLRVDTNAEKIITQAQWLQTGGPVPDEITYQEDSDGSALQNIFFTAPEISQDTVMAFEVTLTFDDSSQAKDSVLVGVKHADINASSFFTDNGFFVTTDMVPYVSDSPFAEVLGDCVYNNVITQSCTFAQLPLIGMQTTTPDINTILNKTFVSHPWMGDRFVEFLSQSATAPDMINLLRGVTAIVISYDIRPSFYWVRTGTIYLDARNFWRTPEERDTLNTAADYRSGFGADLQFGIYWRYVKNNRYFYPQISLAQSARNSRDFEQLEAALAWLLYHELAHANDYFPPSSWSSMTNSDDPRSYFLDNETQSSLMYSNYPLESDLLNGLAKVSFGGNTATTAQMNVTPTEAANEFASDIAPAYYAYYTEREDYAMLFEQFMMLYRLGVSADIGVIGTQNNSDALVTWGQRNRINAPNLQARTAFAVERILPQLNVATIQPTLPYPELMNAGESWYDFNAIISSGVNITTLQDSSKLNTHPRPPLIAEEFERYTINP